MNRSTFLKNLIGLYGFSSLPVGAVKQYQKIYVLQCFIRGFQYYNGPKLLPEINKTGLLELVREPKNKYDANAIALFFNRQKIGFIPAESNEVLARLMDANLIEFQAEIARVEPKASSWENVFVAIYALKELEWFENKENFEKFGVLETPKYYTLKSSTDFYARIYLEEEEIINNQQPDYYQLLIDHSTTDHVYSLIHNSFPNESQFNKAFYGNKLILNAKNLSNIESLDFCNEVIVKLNDLKNEINQQATFLEVNLNELVKIPDKIEKFVEIIDEKGNSFFEVVLKPEI